jgi:hypothetical protein
MVLSVELKNLLTWIPSFIDPLFYFFKNSYEASVELNTPYMLIPNFIIFSSIWKHPLNLTLLSCWTQILYIFSSIWKHPLNLTLLSCWTQVFIHSYFRNCTEEFVELNTPYVLNPSFIHPFQKKFTWRNLLNFTLLLCWTQVLYIHFKKNSRGGICWTSHSFCVEHKFYTSISKKNYLEEFVELHTPSMLNPSFIHPYFF